MNVLGLDIGGANIKASDADGRTASKAFPMWTRFAELSAVLKDWYETDLMAAGIPATDMIAVTMTAELADCFKSKQEGVASIIRSVQEAFPDKSVQVWMTSGEFADADDAINLSQLVAASNWHALATWTGRGIPQGPALLIDIGSTTSDIIPLLDGQPISTGLNDFERLCSGELVYTGTGRTPVCAIVKSVPVLQQNCPIAAELFATSKDAYLVAGLIAEDSGNTDTADNRPFTRENSLNRMAHMLCCDATELDANILEEIAAHVVEQQVIEVSNAVNRVLQQLDQNMMHEGGRSLTKERPTVILSGSGTVLAKLVVERVGTERFANCMNLQQMFVRPISESACAFAVARLAHDRCQDDMLEMSVF